jgi:hypothetical protein
MTKHLIRALPPLLVGLVLGFNIRNFESAPPKPNAPAETGVSEKTFHRLPEQRGPVSPEQRSDFISLINKGPGDCATSDWMERLQLSAAGLSLAEIQTALDSLKNIADSYARSKALAAIVRRWAQLDETGAFGYTTSLAEGEMKAQAMAAVASILARTDLQFIAAQAASMPNTRSSRECIKELANTWSETDPHAALGWAQGLPEGPGKQDALFAICSRLGNQDPQDASAQISQLPAGDSKDFLINHLAAQWGANDPKKAAEWANTLPPAEKALAMSNLAGAWAQRDPIAAGNLVVKLPQGEAQNQAALAVALSWASQNPAAAAAWVLQFPEATQAQGIREVVNTWASMDSGQALDWVKALPEGTTRDAALKSYVESIAYWTPDKAAEITGLINDQTTRNESLDITMRSWSETDPATARNWLAKSNVPEESKARLQALLPMN